MLIHRFGIGLVCITVLSLTAPVSVISQCAEITPQKGELGYQERGNRCEGLYVERTRSALRLKSFLGNFASDPNANIEGSISVKLPSDVPSDHYHLRVNSLDPRIHYQLDALLEKSGTFSWPISDVLGKADEIDIAMLAPLSWAIGSTTEHYIPVSLSIGNKLTDAYGSNRALVLVESTVPVSRYIARLTPEPDGELVDLTTQLKQPTTLLELPIPEYAKTGFHKLWLRVLMMGESKPEQQSWMIWIP